MSKKEPEMPRNHQIQLLCLLGMVNVLVIDTVAGLFGLGTTVVLGFIPVWIRLILFGIFMFFALTLIIRSHNALFGSGHEPPDHLVTDGIFQQLRHPMYTGVILIYFSFVLLTASLVGLGLLIGIILIYNFTLMDPEEEFLEDAYGDQYREYKETTRKWELG